MSETYDEFRSRILTQALLKTCPKNIDKETLETIFDYMGIKKKPHDETLDTPDLMDSDT